MIIKEIPIKEIDVSEFNTRKDFSDVQKDSSLEDLARSIETQGLLSPITVFQKANGRYVVIAGQRRLMACRQLGWATITAILRYGVDEDEARALSLVENVHRADMNPHDKALAFRALLDRLGDVQSVSRETGVRPVTVRKYLRLLELAPELQAKLAAGETKQTEALVRLSQRFEASETQVAVWDKIGGLPQETQIAVLKRIDPDLENLEALVSQAAVKTANRPAPRNCPFDCSAIPEPLKKHIAGLIEAFQAGATEAKK